MVWNILTQRGPSHLAHRCDGLDLHDFSAHFHACLNIGSTFYKMANIINTDITDYWTRNSRSVRLMFSPMQNPRILDCYVNHPTKNCPPPLFLPYICSIVIAVLVHPISPTHVCIILMNGIWLSDLDPLLFFRWPPVHFHSWIEAMNIRCYSYNRIISPANETNLIFGVKNRI